MPSTPYDLVEDDQDLRIPIHADQAFHHGITFNAKKHGLLCRFPQRYLFLTYSFRSDASFLEHARIHGLKTVSV
uniref:Uncharacterized protein n=1 Tax=Megaselia scalaris TaxID=36166 RepID=T1GJI2_MEGSC